MALGSAMSSFAIVDRSAIRHLRARAVEERADRGEPVQRLALHHAQDDGRLHRPRARSGGPTSGTHRQRLDALRDGKVEAASLQEPWISVAEKQGCRVLIESHSTRSEAAGDELDGPTLAKMFRAEARAAEAIQTES